MKRVQKSWFWMFITVCSVCVFPSSSKTQALPDLIKQLGIEQLARDYLRPGADLLGYSFNSGLYHTAKVEQGFHFWMGLRGVIGYVPQTDKTFTAALPSEFTLLGYPSQISTATIFGGKGAVLHSTNTDENIHTPDITLPDGTNLRNTFIVLPHATIGSFAATELMVRGIPPVTFDPEIGKISFFGIGIRHCPSRYIELPLDFAVMASMQQFHIGDVMTVTNLNANVHTSMRIMGVSPFAGFGYESYTIDVAYTYVPIDSDLPSELNTPATIALDFRRSNFRMTVGVNITFIPLIDITADYSFGEMNTLTIGAGLTL